MKVNLVAWDTMIYPDFEEAKNSNDYITILKYKDESDPILEEVKNSFRRVTEFNSYELQIIPWLLDENKNS